MHKTIKDAKLFFDEFNHSSLENVGIIFCPSFTLLQSVKAFLKKNFLLGAQNVFWEEEGAYTGEISPKMLVDLGCSHAIIGHSERRHILGETDEMVNRKTVACLKFGLVPIVCVGETLAEMQNGSTRTVIEKQLNEGLKNVQVKSGKDLILAYEPVWAIGTEKADSPEQSNETIGMIRDRLSRLFGASISEAVCVLYGGSVKPENIQGFMAKPGIDGALVGGASLNPKSFTQVIALGSKSF